MKPLILLAISLLGIVICPAQNAPSQSTIITIRSNGTALAASETIQTRTTSESQLRYYERIARMRDSFGDELPGNQPVASTNGTVTRDTLEEVAAKLRAVMLESQNEDIASNLEVIAENGNVRIRVAREFADLEELLSEAPFSQQWLPFGDVQFMTTNGLLQVTFAPEPEAQRYSRLLKTQLKASGLRTELRLVLPGAVTASPWTGMSTNATWLTLDGTNSASIDAALKILESPAVITAEAGGLSLAEPINSQSLRTRARAEDPSSNLPIVDAGPGFIAEPKSVTLTTVHVFPEGLKLRSQRDSFHPGKGLVVQASLFGPEDRVLRSISDVRVLSAKDNKGRALPVGSGNAGEGMMMAEFSGGSEAGDGIQFTLQLPLPEPDAEAIEELSAQAIALTAGGWKEILVPAIRAGNTNETDLSEMLPGAKLVLKQVRSKGKQMEMDVEVTGPPEISQMLIDAKETSDDMYSYSSQNSFRNRNGKATRRVRVEVRWYDDETPPDLSVTLSVRFPQDQRRERVPIKLTGIDLL